MKRLSWLLLIGLLVAYTNSYAFLRLGVKAGANIAKVSVSNGPANYSYKDLTGFAAGVQADVALIPTMSIRTDVLYVQKGSKFTTPTTSDGKLKLDEFVIAPFWVLRFPLPKIIPFFQIGPEVGLNTLAKSEAGGTSALVGPNYKKSDFSLNIGAGIILPFMSNDLTLDARYNLGLADLNKGSVNTSNGTITPKTKTNGIQIFLGYNFFKI
jgi:opacity protein-like surface antigen